MIYQHKLQELGREMWEQTARQLHTWYLEATQKISPDSFNKNAQKSYDELSDEQKSIDLYIAGKLIERVSEVIKLGFTQEEDK